MYLKPVGFALFGAECGHRLSKLLFAVHPPGEFLGSVFVSGSDLILMHVAVRHLFLLRIRQRPNVALLPGRPRPEAVAGTFL